MKSEPSSPAWLYSSSPMSGHRGGRQMGVRLEPFHAACTLQATHVTNEQVASYKLRVDELEKWRTHCV